MDVQFILISRKIHEDQSTTITGTTTTTMIEIIMRTVSVEVVLILMGLNSVGVVIRNTTMIKMHHHYHLLNLQNDVV